MRQNFIILISILLLAQIILAKKESNDENNTSKVNHEIYNEDKGYFSPELIHELNDISFDYYIRQGKIYRWFILFYSRSCGHCKRAKKEIQKIFEDYKNISSLRFSQIEAYQNTMTNVRFNISGVPYMILVENNTIYEMDLFPNYDNLKDFIFTDFKEVKDELKPLPKKVKFIYVTWLILKQTLGDFTQSFNKFLKKEGISFQFNTLGFVGCILALVILICWGCIRFCLNCCCNDEDFMNELKRLEEEFDKKKTEIEKDGNKEQKDAKEEEEEGEDGEEYEYEEEEEDDEVEQVEDGQKLTEEEKKKLEEKKRKKIEEEKEKLEKEKKDNEGKEEKEEIEDKEENNEKETKEDKEDKNKKEKKE